MKKDKKEFKIIIINNEKPIRKSIDFIYKNDNFNNHLEYWDEYLKNKEFNSVKRDDIYSEDRNTIGLKICMEGNIVFIDTSVSYNDYKSGIIFLPDNVKSSRKKLIYLLTAKYDYLSVIFDIENENGLIHGKQEDIFKKSNEVPKKKVYR